MFFLKKYFYLGENIWKKEWLQQVFIRVWISYSELKNSGTIATEK